jgi:hypothetical protein
MRGSGIPEQSRDVHGNKSIASTSGARLDRRPR